MHSTAQIFVSCHGSTQSTQLAWHLSRRHHRSIFLVASVLCGRSRLTSKSFHRKTGNSRWLLFALELLLPSLSAKIWPALAKTAAVITFGLIHRFHWLRFSAREPSPTNRSRFNLTLLPRLAACLVTAVIQITSLLKNLRFGNLDLKSIEMQT